MVCKDKVPTKTAEYRMLDLQVQTTSSAGGATITNLIFFSTLHSQFGRHDWLQIKN